MLIRRVSAVRRWLGISGSADCNGEQRQAARECLKHGVVLRMIRQNAATDIASSSRLSCAVSRLAWIPDALQTQEWCPELEPAPVAELPQPVHKARAPNTEQFTACSLRIAPNDSEPFIVLHVGLHQRRAVSVDLS